MTKPSSQSLRGHCRPVMRDSMRAFKRGRPRASARESAALDQIQAFTATSIFALMASRLALLKTLR